MVNEVEDFPWEGEYPSGPFAKLLKHSAETLGYTHSFYEVRRPDGTLILAAGVAVWSFVRPPELWLILAKPYLKNLRENLHLTREALHLPLKKYPDLVCEVEKGYKREEHFVKHIGWKPSGYPSLRPDGHNFTQFRVE